MDPIVTENNIGVKIVPIIARFLLGVLVILLAIWVSSAPRNMPTKTFVRVSHGESLSQISSNLFAGHYIRSTVLFQSLVVFFAGDKSVVAGDYYFDKPVPVWTVARMMSTGDYNIKPIKVTFWEGMNNREIAELVHSNISSIDEDVFVEKAKQLEGYLFPDTYFLSPFVTVDDVIKQMNDNFKKQVAVFSEDIKNGGHSEHEIITMASIIEKESNGKNDRDLISSVLWNRIIRGDRLQVDASFVYLLGKESKDLTVTDLKLDSPYNTYVYKGLPPGPIGNPGIESIRAALNPAQTGYLFYLHANDGSIHLAKTFAEHIKNKAKYLR